MKRSEMNWSKLSKGSQKFTSVPLSPCLVFPQLPPILPPTPLVSHSTGRGSVRGWNPFWMASSGHLLNSRELEGSFCVWVPRVLSFICPVITAVCFHSSWLLHLSYMAAFIHLTTEESQLCPLFIILKAPKPIFT